MGLPHLASAMLQQGTAGNVSSATGYNWSRMHAAAIDHGAAQRRWTEPYNQSSKRLFDLFAALILLTLLLPVFVTIALFARRDGGPVLFGHWRLGAGGQRFRCWKFRTMVPNAERVLAEVLAKDPKARAEWEKDFKLRNDPRITPVGRFLRATSLDELPQLFNVLSGHMSLVGPRPIVTDEIKRYGAAFHDYARCRPGITGKWQVSGRNDVGYRERVELDRQYARQWTFLSDVALLLRTPFVVLRRSGAY
jgi:exopolysaccharide production protein ExoY